MRGHRDHPTINGREPRDVVDYVAIGWFAAQRRIDALNGVDHPDTVAPDNYAFLDGGITW